MRDVVGWQVEMRDSRVAARWPAAIRRASTPAERGPLTSAGIAPRSGGAALPRAWVIAYALAGRAASPRLSCVVSRGPRDLAGRRGRKAGAALQGKNDGPGRRPPERSSTSAGKPSPPPRRRPQELPGSHTPIRGGVSGEYHYCTPCTFMNILSPHPYALPGSAAGRRLVLLSIYYIIRQHLPEGMVS